MSTDHLPINDTPSRSSPSPTSILTPRRAISHSLNMTKLNEALATTPGATRRGRQSSFKELDLDTFSETEANLVRRAPRRRVRFESQSDVFEASDNEQTSPLSTSDASPSPRIRRAPNYKVQLKKSAISTPPSAASTLLRMFPLAFIVVSVLAILQSSPLLGLKSGKIPIGVAGGVIRAPREKEPVLDQELESRQNDPTNYCTRWSHQTALVNGTLYIYGGRATQHAGQTGNTWNNDFLSLSLNNTFQITSSGLKGLPQPSGPPAVANGYLWNSYDSLFLYGGEYSDNPATPPSPFSMWEYNITAGTWIEHKSPQTSDGVNSDGGNQPVQNSAEGAGFSVPELGRAWYFGGHQDEFTTSGWSNQIARIYLKSLLEFTFPGYSNDGIKSLGGGKQAGSDGAWRNITQGGLQVTNGFTERADGVLVHVPGYGPQGIILGLAGGTNTTFTEMNVVDVYDIASSTWYKQATNGTTPSIRVNPCAVAASAADGTSTNIYLYGGQNLIPYDQQIQYGDMWILSIPSFTWILADTSGQSVPPPRAGHTCNIWDSQIIVIGGYVGPNISCDIGVYVFDASELKWQNQFTSLGGGNPQNQQASQSQNSSGLSGSNGYQVPLAVQSIIGGSGLGGATVTAPAMTPTSGPLATGHPITYTVTASNGAVITETGSAGGGSGGGSIGSNQQSSGPNIAAIVAGVVAGVFFIVACYLGFCAWVYRRQLVLYKRHVAMTQRAAAAGPGEKSAFLASDGPPSKSKRSSDRSSGPSGVGTGTGSNANSNGIESARPVPPMEAITTNSTANSSTEDLMTGHEPSFVGVLLNPRRSLRVINRD